MLAEKFLLILETLLSCGVVQTGNYPDGSPRLISRAPFVPIKYGSGQRTMALNGAACIFAASTLPLPLDNS